MGVDIDAKGLEGVATQVANNGGQMHTIVADLSSAEECRRVIREAAGILGGIDVLWCHASC